MFKQLGLSCLHLHSFGYNLNLILIFFFATLLVWQYMYSIFIFCAFASIVLGVTSGVCVPAETWAFTKRTRRSSEWLWGSHQTARFPQAALQRDGKRQNIFNWMCQNHKLESQGWVFLCRRSSWVLWRRIWPWRRPAGWSWRQSCRAPSPLWRRSWSWRENSTTGRYRNLLCRNWCYVLPSKL